MGKYLIISCCWFFMGMTVFAGDGEYAVGRISPGMLKGANVVKRSEEIRYEISSLTKARLYRKFALTILNENGDNHSELVVHYDKFRSVKSIEGKLFDAFGKEIKSLKNKDIDDRSNVSGVSLMEDNRVKLHNFYYRIYPYTIEYEVVLEFNNTLVFYPWLPQPAEMFSVEKSGITVVCPSWYSFQYKTFNYSGAPLVSEVKDGKSYYWEVKELKAIKSEYATPEWEVLTTSVFFKPLEFEFGGYKGSMNTWNELGKFQLQLNEGRDKLPEAVKLEVHRLADPVKDNRDKVRILYEYLQKNTRYISVQLGIGGLQPFDASYVAKNAYGDCKALTNYMYSLLKEVNVKSCYTQIKSGRGENFFMPDFPCDQFDHIILCVPMSKDSMWLECTSQTLPAGYLSGFTSDRYALLVDENGGHLVRTPKYGIRENLQLRRVSAVLDEDDNLQLNSATVYSGLQQDSYHSLINGLSKDKVKEILHEQLDFATYEVNSFDYRETRSVLPEVEEKLDISVSNYATITGKRLFIVPNVMTRTYRRLTPNEDRKYDIELGFEYKDVDTVEISIPAGYSAESVPADISLSTKFGNYQCRVNFEGNRIRYYRSIEHFSGTFPAKDYAELVKFYDAMYKADRNKLVLVKNETASKGF